MIKCNVCGTIIDDETLTRCPSCDSVLIKKSTEKAPDQTLARMVKYATLIDTEPLYNCAIYNKSQLTERSNEQDLYNVVALLQELAYIAYHEDDIVLAIHYLERALRIEENNDWRGSKKNP